MSDSDHRKVATHILGTANKVVTTERGNQHGGAEDSFAMIGQLWQTYLNNTRGNSGTIAHEGIQVTAYDVAQMMTLLKVARATHGNPQNEDNYVDAAGYQSLAAAIANVKVPEPQATNTQGVATAATAPRSIPRETTRMAEKLAPRDNGADMEGKMEKTGLSALVDALDRPIEG